MTPEQERDCLALNPFEGDRDVTYRVLRDGFVRARNRGKCMTCLGPVAPGTRVRARVEIFEGKVHTFRFCEECCAAMAASWGDEGRAWLARSELGSRRAAQHRNRGRGRAGGTKP